MRSTSHPLGWLESKSQTITNAAEDAKKSEPLCIAGANAKKMTQPLRKTVWQFLRKLDMDYHRTLQFHSYVYTQEN